MAWVMVAVPFRLLALKFTLYQVHKSLGLLVLLATIARLGWRLYRGRPAWEPGLARWEIGAARVGHALLLALLLVVPLLGVLTADTAALRIPTRFLGLVPVPALIGADAAVFPLLRDVHRGSAILLVLLAAGHGVMAVRHHCRGRAVLRTMWRWRL